MPAIIIPNAIAIECKVKVQLEAISPISFEVVRRGDILRIQKKEPKPNEYRDKIGPATQSYLLFKDRTKIGIISSAVSKTIPFLSNQKYCRVIEIDSTSGKIIVQLAKSSSIQEEDKTT
jgi:hypothetical protein